MRNPAENCAGVPGLEPRTTEPESAVLPITPYPKAFRPKSCRGSSLPDPRHAAKPSRPSGASADGLHQGAEAAHRLGLAEQLHRLEERRRDAATTGRDPQRAVGDARLQAEA